MLEVFKIPLEITGVYQLGYTSHDSTSTAFLENLKGLSLLNLRGEQELMGLCLCHDYHGIYFHLFCVTIQLYMREKVNFGVLKCLGFFFFSIQSRLCNQSWLYVLFCYQ